MLQKKLFSSNGLYKAPNFLLSAFLTFFLASCGPLSKEKEANYVLKDGTVYLTNKELSSTRGLSEKWPSVFIGNKNIFDVSVELRSEAEQLLKQKKLPAVVLVDVPFVDSASWYDDTSYKDGVFSVSAETFQAVQFFLKKHQKQGTDYFGSQDLPLNRVEISPEAILLFNYVNNKNKDILFQLISGEQDIFQEMEMNFCAYDEALKIIAIRINIQVQQLMEKGYAPIISINYFAGDTDQKIDPLYFYLKSYLLPTLFERYSLAFALENDQQKKFYYLDELAKNISKKDVITLQHRFLKNPAVLNYIMQNRVISPEQEVVYKIIIQWLKEDLNITPVYSLDI